MRSTFHAVKKRKTHIVIIQVAVSDWTLFLSWLCCHSDVVFDELRWVVFQAGPGALLCSFCFKFWEIQVLVGSFSFETTT